ncbi:MAG: hypothetical protein U5K69_28565 [Balneolaceae bacterium]|nr:hypothetical protein [Balneolaceae bacterium]
MIGTYRKNEIPTQHFWQTTWLGANLMLFCTQLILFPINYGILQLPNQYPEVEVVVDDAVSQDPAWPADEQLMLLDDQNGKYYLYSRSERRLWYIKDSDIHSISYSGMTNVFQTPTPADSTTK